MNPREESPTLFSPFWPLCMVAVSVAILFGWQVTVVVRQYRDLVRVEVSQQAERKVQAEQIAKAAQVDGKIFALMTDLLKLSKTDADALTLVNKHGIKVNQPASQPALPAGMLQPQSRPQVEGSRTAEP